MPKRVVIVGAICPYLGPKEDGTEIWGCNSAYQHQPGLDRLYAFDCIERVFLPKRPQFIEEVSALGIPVVLRSPHPQIPKSEAYPLYQNLRKIYGAHLTEKECEEAAYFTSSIAYMLCDALCKGIPEVVVHRILRIADGVSIEYMTQKPCLDYWCGMLGVQRRLLISNDSNLCKPAPWETGLYGYEIMSSEEPNNVITSSAVVAHSMPVQRLPAPHPY